MKIIIDDVTLVGINLGKHSFHLHGQDRCGKEIFCKRCSRKMLIELRATFYPGTVVMEACAGSYHMVRHLITLGNDGKLSNSQFVRLFVKSNKNDLVDNEAICEAAICLNMHLVTPKTEVQQLLGALQRMRESLVMDQVKTTN